MNRCNLFSIIASVLIMFSITGCGKQQPAQTKTAEKTVPVSKNKAKVLFVNSYHKGYDWSDRQQAGAEEILAEAGAEIKIIYMDTKNNPSEEFKQTAAIAAKNTIQQFQPDVVITGDDNAFKYLIMPYYKDASLPVVFCGLNWDASEYQAPYSNTTGILEIALIEQLVDTMKVYAKGNRIGFISGEVLSEHKNAEYFVKYCKIQLAQTKYAKTFEEWKQDFIELQDNVDMLIIGVSAGIKNWDEIEAQKFVLQEIKIPTGVEAKWMMPYALVGYVKVPEEQGQWAAKAALEIIAGKKPVEIPVAKNKKAQIYLNMKIAKKLGIVFPIDLISQAEFFN